MFWVKNSLICRNFHFLSYQDLSKNLNISDVSKELLHALSSKLSAIEASGNIQQESINFPTMVEDGKLRILRLLSTVYKHVQTINESEEEKLISGTLS